MVKAKQAQLTDSNGFPVGYGTLVGSRTLLSAAHVVSAAVKANIDGAEFEIQSRFILPHYVRHGHPSAALVVLTRDAVPELTPPVAIATNIGPRERLENDIAVHTRDFGGQVVKVEVGDVGESKQPVSIPIWLQLMGTSSQEGDSGSYLVLAGKEGQGVERVAAVIHGLTPHRAQPRRASRAPTHHPRPFFYVCPLDCLKTPGLFHMVPPAILPLLEQLESFPPTFFDGSWVGLTIGDWLTQFEEEDKQPLRSLPVTLQQQQQQRELVLSPLMPDSFRPRNRRRNAQD
ncbi:unnamed protein product [Vitrella brassicaformis CCMP3155]|uniref:Peptidase S1 domain-containing protein n=1 Tax=Vitrella brassicaformis (strain CCMP3155) TaxID=1169540 RepID=A0A0G4FYP1_VITBC|nr:unnamed protein product [Vitrella brassicaformis CCMP3155]|eukprot:CEM20530.1 unnamed protein product [Vitrella brassicaformis CCMP3155]